MADYPFIKYSITNQVATIALNSPKTLNALRQPMRFEIIDAVKQAEDDDEVRVVILTGEGRGLCAGADLSEEMPDHDSFAGQCAADTCLG